MSDLLRVEDLRLAFGETQVVHGLRFEIRPGETLALVGESGSGKSVSALSILRLVEREGGHIAGGRILFQSGETEIDITALDETALTNLRGSAISMDFQEPMTSLNPVLTIGDQVSEVFIRHQALSRADAMAASEKRWPGGRSPSPGGGSGSIRTSCPAGCDSA